MTLLPRLVVIVLLGILFVELSVVAVDVVVLFGFPAFFWWLGHHLLDWSRWNHRLATYIGTIGLFLTALVAILEPK